MVSDATALSISSASPLATDKAIRHELLSDVRSVGNSLRPPGPLPLATSISIAWRFAIICKQITTLIKQGHNATQNDKQKSPLILEKKVLFPIASNFGIVHNITKRAKW
jgi:hypothetical protein